MRPIKLVMCGWGPYPDRVEVDFTGFYEKGIFLITGATGAGKTTVFDAITYALYGALSGTERDKERSSVRSDFADAQTPTYVELTMEHGGKEYRIYRNPEYLRPKKRGGSERFTKEKENAILYLPEALKEEEETKGHSDSKNLSSRYIVEGNREVNAALQELLVLDCQQFKKISMIAQGEFARLLVASPKEKTGIFREIFGTGIYEKFTKELGRRARELYVKVAAHKNKLEEDICVMTVGMEKSAWDEETQDKLLSLTAEEGWNYEELWKCLEQMEQTAAEKVRVEKKECARAEKAVEAQVQAIAAWEERNRRIQEFQASSEKLQALEALQEDYREKEACLKRAVNAAFAAGAWERQRSLEKQLLQNQEERKLQTGALLSGRREREALLPVAEKAEHIAKLLKVSADYSKLEREKDCLEKQYAEQSGQFQADREKYFLEEKKCREQSRAYDEAERKRRLAAIGLAAALLEEGRPCPVCGSMTHPNPAAIAEEVVSEEELEKLKKQAEAGEAVLQKFHEKLVTAKTRTEQLAERLLTQENQLQELRQILLSEKDPLVKEYLFAQPALAEKKLRGECERVRELEGLLREKEEVMKRLTEQEESLLQEREDAERIFVQILEKYGFAERNFFVKAQMPEKDREKLEREIREYQEQLSAAREVYEHLRRSLEEGGDKTCLTLTDLTLPNEKLCGLRAKKDQIQKQHKVWEAQLTEVKKTLRLAKERYRVMEEDAKEYGFVKDLENMASGNNAKRLVFEQYVLAGYFEEILRAANLRLYKMTSGRYEMSRVGEVGDGRVKDNLEVQVLDNYTGKNRSVRTLSGGETFKASLCLALGMSDVIQAMNGGIRVDTLFVDEGFGALDSESLDQACDALMSLAGKNCLIGIISHVPELGERIDRQLIIDKTGSGSFIRNCI